MHRSNDTQPPRPPRRCRSRHLAAPLLVLALVLSAVQANAEAATPTSPYGAIEGVVTNRWAKWLPHPTLVYIEHIPGDHRAQKDEVTVIDQRDRKFIPRVVAVLPGSLVELQNNDYTVHEIYCHKQENPNYGEFDPGESVIRAYKNIGVYPHTCSIHPKMRAYVIVLQNLYYDFTDDKGRFVIKNVPEGSWQVKVWNEKLWDKETNATFPVTVKKNETSKMTISF